jgi:acid phosphatase family membrane protein YuiD
MLQPEAKEQTNRVRQGVTGHNVWLVLAGGLLGVVVAFFLVYWFFLAGAPNPVGGS